MIKYRGYNIYTENDSLDVDCDNNDHSGYVDHMKSGKDIIYWIQGDLPELICKKLAQLAESKDWKYYYNNGSRKDVNWESIRWSLQNK
jgi:hypothetical protein